MEQFSKKIQIRDGTGVCIRPLDRMDGPALLSFYTALPENDRLFLKEDVTKKEVVRRLIDEIESDRVLSIVAEKKDAAIIGDARLYLSDFGWQRHMAEIRCVVSREYQQKGLGTALMRELVAQAVEKRVLKISSSLMDTQESARRAFERIGFKKEAELKDFVIDINGELHNLILMVDDVSELWEKMEDLLHYYDIRTIL